MTTTHLRDALDAVYEAFAPPARAPSLDACDHCGDDYSHLTTGDLRTIPASTISGYVGSVFNTCGSETDFRYFFPRLLELIFEKNGLEPEVVLGKLRNAHWTSWRSAMRGAVEHAVLVGLQDVCLAGEKCHLVDGILCGASLAGVRMEPLFDVVAQHPSVVAELYFANLDESLEVLPRNAFADEAYSRALTEFLSSPAAKSHVDAAWYSLGARPTGSKQ
jgi:hypothetical protein